MVDQSCYELLSGAKLEQDLSTVATRRSRNPRLDIDRIHKRSLIPSRTPLLTERKIKSRSLKVSGAKGCVWHYFFKAGKNLGVVDPTTTAIEREHLALSV